MWPLRWKSSRACAPSTKCWALTPSPNDTPMKFQRLALIGCGLMGGSFALALRRAGLVAHVAGFSASEGTRVKALELGVIDSACASAAEAVQGADLVLVAVPVRATEATLRAMDPGLSPDA